MRLHEPLPVVTPDESHTDRPRGRPLWRQRLVEVERGLAEGFRSESAFFVYLFVGAACVMAGLVLGLEFFEWTTLGMALTIVFVAEMFHQAIRALLAMHPPGDHRQSLRILRLGTASVFVACLGSSATILALFIRHLMAMAGE